MGKEGEVFLGRVHRTVGSVVGHENEPGFVGFSLFFHPSESFVGEEVSQVVIGEFFHGRAVALNAVFALSREVAVASSEHATEVIEAAFIGVKAFAHALVPLADQGSGVTRVLEVITEGMFAGRQAEQLGSCRVGVVALVKVALVAEAARVATREETCPRRRTHRARDVALFAENSGSSQRVEVGRTQML